ncbi:MAG: hypothetical protein U0359_04110 [Byssovorax sp.]
MIRRTKIAALTWTLFPLALSVMTLGPACGSGGGGSGGATTTTTTTGSGGTGGDCGECFRAVNCVKECGGAVLQSGCCPCPQGTFDDIACSMDGGPDGDDGGG